jgi:hypothetical protein
MTTYRPPPQKAARKQPTSWAQAAAFFGLAAGLSFASKSLTINAASSEVKHLGHFWPGSGAHLRRQPAALTSYTAACTVCVQIGQHISASGLSARYISAAMLDHLE